MNVLVVGSLLAFCAAAAADIWGIVDATRRPTQAWKRAGQNKVVWIVLQAAGLVVWIGLIMTVIYFLAIRPSVKRAESALASDFQPKG